MTIAKPILLIQINAPYPTTNDMWRNEKGMGYSFQQSMEEKFSDYHVLCFNGYDSYSKANQLMIELKVFNHENISNVNFEELKNIIKNSLNATT